MILVRSPSYITVEINEIQSVMFNKTVLRVDTGIQQQSKVVKIPYQAQVFTWDLFSAFYEVNSYRHTVL